MTKNKTLFRLQLNLFARIAFSLVFLFLPLSALGQKTQKSRSMMWQIKSGKNTAYVLGSIHAATKDFYPLPKEIEDAYESSDKLLLEVDPTKADPGDDSLFLLTYGIYEGDDTLWKHLDEKTAERLRKFLAAYKIPPATFDKQKPFMVALGIDAISNSKSGAQVQSNLGIDLYFFNKAKDKKQIVGLETTEFHWQIYANQPEDVQMRYLNAMLDQSETTRNDVGEILTLWLKGDEKQIDRAVSEILLREPVELERELREKRNPKMAEAIENCLKNGERCFMVVGTAHVVGKEGIIRILKNKGYQAQQVEVNSQTKNNGKSDPKE